MNGNPLQFLSLYVSDFSRHSENSSNFVPETKPIKFGQHNFMKQNPLLLITVAVLTLTGCEKNSANVAQKTHSGQIQFSAKFSEHKTRATAEAPGDNLIGIFYTTDGIIELQKEYTNVPYEMGRNGDVLYPATDRKIQVPEEGKQATIIAYTPFNTDLMKLYPLDISIQKISDCQLYYTFSKNVIGSRDNKVKLELSPVLSKISIYLNGKRDFDMETLNGASITFSGLPATAKFNLQTGQLQNIAKPDKDMVFEFSDEAHTACCLMLPVEDIEEAGITLRLPNIEDDNLKETTYKLSEYTDGFKASTAYDFDFDFIGGQAIFRITETSINNWNEGDNIVIPIPEEDLE